jgi:hypothetical protein
MKFLAVRWVGLMTHCELLHGQSVSRSHDWCGVRTEPPTQALALGRLLKLTFWHLTLSAQKRCHMDLYWLNWFSLIIIFTNIINYLLRLYLEIE